MSTQCCSNVHDICTMLGGHCTDITQLPTIERQEVLKLLVFTKWMYNIMNKHNRNNNSSPKLYTRKYSPKFYFSKTLNLAFLQSFMKFRKLVTWLFYYGCVNHYKKCQVKASSIFPLIHEHSYLLTFPNYSTRK